MRTQIILGPSSTFTQDQLTGVQAYAKPDVTGRWGCCPAEPRRGGSGASGTAIPRMRQHFWVGNSVGNSDMLQACGLGSSQP